MPFHFQKQIYFQNKCVNYAFIRACREKKKKDEQGQCECAVTIHVNNAQSR